nr:MAG: SCO family protein [Pseudomonadota bacterium]
MIARCVLLRWVAVVATVLLGAGVSVAAPVRPEERVDRVDPVPAQLAAVDVKERLGHYVPKDLAFRDESGRTVLLGELFDGRTPVILTLNYSNCPMLCSLQLNGLIQGLKQVEWGINREYRIVTVSLEPHEPQEVAQRTLNRYLTQYGRPEARGGWRFLAGSEANVRAFADAIGFSYRYDERSQEYAHPAAIALAAPDGKLVRYLYGLEYDPKTLRLGLVEASEGRIGTTLDRLILYCFHYDSSVGRYAPVARKIMQVGGLAAVLLLAGFLAVLFRADAKRRRRLAQGTLP